MTWLTQIVAFVVIVGAVAFIGVSLWAAVTSDPNKRWQREMREWIENVRRSVLAEADRAVQAKIDRAWNEGWQLAHNQHEARVGTLENARRRQDAELNALAILWLRGRRQRPAKPSAQEMDALKVFEQMIERQTTLGQVKEKLGAALRKAEGV